MNISLFILCAKMPGRHYRESEILLTFFNFSVDRIFLSMNPWIGPFSNLPSVSGRLLPLTSIASRHFNDGLRKKWAHLNSISCMASAVKHEETRAQALSALTFYTDTPIHTNSIFRSTAHTITWWYCMEKKFSPNGEKKYLLRRKSNNKTRNGIGQVEKLFMVNIRWSHPPSLVRSYAFLSFPFFLFHRIGRSFVVGDWLQLASWTDGQLWPFHDFTSTAVESPTSHSHSDVSSFVFRFPHDVHSPHAWYKKRVHYLAEGWTEVGRATLHSISFIVQFCSNVKRWLNVVWTKINKRISHVFSAVKLITRANKKCRKGE